MQHLVLCLVLCAVGALSRSNPTPPPQQYYTFTGQYSEGCVIGSGCKCAVVTYNMSGNFYLLTEAAGLVLQSFAFALVGNDRIIDGYGVLHQNQTFHTQVGDFVLSDLGQTVLLTVEEEYTTPLPEIVVGNASDRGTCYQRSLQFLATPSKQ